MDAPGWEWQDDTDHRRWYEEYDRHLKTDNLTQQQLQYTAHAQATAEEQNMRISEEFSGTWLKAIDLHGHRVTVTISHVKREEVGQGEDREFKPVVYFQNKDKGLVLNKTNGLAIADLYGDDTDNWDGKPIVLYSTKVQFGSKMVDAIRVDAATKSAPAQPSAQPEQRPHQGVPADEIDQEIPF